MDEQKRGSFEAEAQRYVGYNRHPRNHPHNRFYFIQG